jgi:transcriptional regulator GlxA family with amidase domain
LTYLHTLRVEHAKNLLRQSSRSILEIAYESGFSDQRTFNRVFKQHTDRTPKEYRRQHLPRKE